MRSMRQRAGAGIVLAAIVTAGFAISGPAAHALVPNTSECPTHLSGDADPDFTLTSSPAAGSSVPAGTDIDVTAGWAAGAWEETDKILVCTTSDGTYDYRLSGGQRPLANDGSFAWSIYLPADTPVGTEVCVREVLYGRSITETQQTQKSDSLCFRTAAALPTTTTTTAPSPTTTTTVATVTPAAPAPVAADPVVVSAGDIAPVRDVVRGEVAVAPMPLAELPRTGGGIAGLLILGGAAIALGGVAIILGRRSSSGSRA